MNLVILMLADHTNPFLERNVLLWKNLVLKNQGPQPWLALKPVQTSFTLKTVCRLPLVTDQPCIRQERLLRGPTALKVCTLPLMQLAEHSQNNDDGNDIPVGCSAKSGRCQDEDLDERSAALLHRLQAIERQNVPSAPPPGISEQRTGATATQAEQFTIHGQLGSPDLLQFPKRRECFCDPSVTDNT